MIPYVNNRLNQWARWVAMGRKVNGLGYPGSVAWVRQPGSGNASPDFDEDAWEVDQAWHAMEQPQPELFKLVLYFYTRNESVERLAMRMGCSRDTVYVRIQQAHQIILGHLNDISAGCFISCRVLDSSDKSVQSASNCG